MDQAAVGIQSGFFHQLGAGTAGLFAGEHPGHDAPGTLGIHLNADFQKAFPLAAVQGQNTVARDFGDRLGIIIILGVDAVLILGLDAGDAAEGAVVTAQFGAAGGIVRNSLSDDVLGTGQRSGGIGDFLVDIVRRCSVGVKGSVLLEQRIGQGLQPASLGDAGAGLALGLIRAVDVLDLGEGFRLGQCGGQLGRHRALLGDGGRDLILALIEAAEVFEAIPEVTQDLVIHRARGFLTVAGDKRDRIALVDQFNRALHVFDV